MCPSHPDEEVRYFCFECLSPPVCSECVVHGIHKGHDVLHIKKAYPVVREKLDGVVQGLRGRVDELQNDKAALNARKAATLEQSEAGRAQIKALIDDLRLRLDKKEKEMNAQLETAEADCIKELESRERLLDDKLNTLLNNIKYVQEHADEGPHPALCFYAENNKLLSQALDQEAKAKDQIASMLLSKSTQLDPEVLKMFKDGINYVAEAIARLRSVPGPAPKERPADRQASFTQNRNAEYPDSHQGSPAGRSYS